MTEKKQIYFAEDGYREWMKQAVEPYLKAYRKYAYIRSYDGTAIFYNEYRAPAAERCIVISHGFCEFAEKYNEVIYYFLNGGFSVYMPEHRGHGYSDRATEDVEKVHVDDFEKYVRDFDCFMNALAGRMEKHRILFAHSMGGAIGARYLEEYPGVFEAAVLSSPMLRMKTGKYPRLVAKLTAYFYTATGRGDVYAAGQSGFDEKPDFEHSSCISRARYDYVFEKRMKNLQYRTYGGTYGWVRAAMKITGILMKKRNLAHINIPVLIFTAGREHMVDNRAAAEFANRVPGVSLIALPDAKHEIFNAGYETRLTYYHEIFSFFRANQSRMVPWKETENEDEEQNEQARKVLGVI